MAPALERGVGLVCLAVLVQRTRAPLSSDPCQQHTTGCAYTTQPGGPSSYASFGTGLYTLKYCKYTTGSQPSGKASSYFNLDSKPIFLVPHFCMLK